MPDNLWAVVAAVHELVPPRRGGRPRIDQRAAFNAVIDRLRTGCQWDRLSERFPRDNAAHRTIQRWLAASVLDWVWAVVAAGAGIAWDRQVIDASVGKARQGGPRGPPPHRQ